MKPSTDARMQSRRQDGIALPMVLVMVTVVAVVTISLLSLATTTLTASRVSKQISERTYAAHAGLDTVIQQIRAGGTICSDGSTLAVRVNNRPAVVTCSPAADSFDVGAGGWSVYINGNSSNPGFETSNAVLADKVITGPVYNGGSWIDMKATITVRDGQVLSGAAGCSDTQFTTKMLTVPVPNFRSCVGNASPAPQVPPALPSVPDTLLPATLPVNPPSTVTGSGSTACRVFEPGIYTTSQPFALSPQMYFKSGVYVLDNTGVVSFERTRRAVAGAPTVGYTPQLSVSCIPPGDGPGALFMLGGNSSIQVTDRGQLEVHPFTPSATSTTSPLSIRTIEAADVGKRTWLTAARVSTLDASQDAVMMDKNKSTLVLRGTVYAPRARVSIDPRGNDALAVITGGVIAGRVVLTAPAAIGPDKLIIGSGVPTVGLRRLQLRSEAVERDWCGCPTDLDPTGPVRRIVAYSTVGVTAAGGLSIESWRIGT
jgi:Tfp pilus assembly protein PilV